MQEPLTVWVQDAELTPPEALPEPHIVPFGWDWKTFHAALLKAHARGEAPDVVEVGDTWTSRLVAEGLLLDITRFATERLRAADLFFPRMLRYCTDPVSGQIYALPLLADARILFYNQDYVEPYLRAHPSGLQSWAAFEQLCQAVQQSMRQPSDSRQNHDRYAIAWPLGQDAFHDVVPWVLAMGGDFVAATGDVLLDSERTQMAIQRLARLVLTGCAPAAPYPPAKDLGEVRNQFRLGRIAIIACALWLMHGGESWIKSTLHPPSPYAVAFVGGSNVSIVRKHGANEMSSEYEPARLLLESSLTNPDTQARLAKSRGKLPSSITALECMKVQEPDANIRTALETFGRALNLASDRGLPNVPNLVDVEEALKACMQEIWRQVGSIKRTSPNAPLAELEQKCRKVIADELGATRKFIEPLLTGCTVKYSKRDVEQLCLEPPSTFDLWLDLRGSAANVRGDVYVRTAPKPVGRIGQKSLQLLRALVSAPRRTASREALVRQIWGLSSARDHQRIKTIHGLVEELTTSIESIQTTQKAADARMHSARARDICEEITHVTNESVTEYTRKLDALRQDVQNLNNALKVPLGRIAIEQSRDPLGEICYTLSHDLAVCLVEA